jgi:hypothetical protein
VKGERKLKPALNLFLAGILGACNVVIEPQNTSIPPGGSTNEARVTETFEVFEPTPTQIIQETAVPFENSQEYERLNQGVLLELFPGSEIYASERGDILLVNQERGVRLAGQRVETRYGSYTFLISDRLYQFLIRSMISETSLDERAVFEAYPDLFSDDPLLRQDLQETLNALSSIQGFREGGEGLAGYPNLSASSRMEEYMRIVSTLLALRQGEISLGSQELSSYQPRPRDFVAVLMGTGNATTFSDLLPEGVFNAEDRTQLVLNTQRDLAFRPREALDDVFVQADFLGTQPLGGRPLEPEMVGAFYEIFYKTYFEIPLRTLLRETARDLGIATNWTRTSYSTPPFADLFSNRDMYYYLTAGSSQTYPIQPPYTSEQILQRYEDLRFGIPKELVEVSFNGLE